jgi:predicted TIM-barrel fold metal-dependent hydrolase
LLLESIGLVDHHAHGILREPPATIDGFRALFSESLDARQFPHVATSLTYRRVLRELADFFNVPPTEDAVFRHRVASDPSEYAARLLRATNTDLLLVDTGFPPGGTTWRELGELAGCTSRPVLRIESGGDVASARANGFVALKTIAAYQGGLDRVSDEVIAALAANEGTGRPLPVQVHCGFGDSDLWLARADPSHLKPLIERFSETPFVLLHCYPFVREAGWLAHVYGNVLFDLSLTIPHVTRPVEAVREALELAPVSKLLYASDASRAPELYYVASKWWREALAVVLAELEPAEAEEAGRRILRGNALALYGLEA